MILERRPGNHSFLPRTQGVCLCIHFSPLSAAEIKRAVQLIRTLTVFTPTLGIISIVLREPVKASVYERIEDALGDRHADAVLFDNGLNTAYKALLNLTADRVMEWEAAPAGAQPTLSLDEQMECEQTILASGAFSEALERHYGITDTRLVMVDIWSAGNYGSEEDRSRRLTRPLCFLRSEPGDNGYARPIEGIRPVVDLNSMEVIRVEEYGIWPLPPQSGNYAAILVANQRTDIKPLEITQPSGPGFSLEGRELTWQKMEACRGLQCA